VARDPPELVLGSCAALEIGGGAQPLERELERGPARLASSLPPALR
jgi:hypothetical protein